MEYEPIDPERAVAIPLKLKYRTASPKGNSARVRTGSAVKKSRRNPKGIRPRRRSYGPF